MIFAATEERFSNIGSLWVFAALAVSLANLQIWGLTNGTLRLLL